MPEHPVSGLSLALETLATSSNLTRTQLQLWYTQQIRPGSVANNMALAFEIRGRLELSRFQRAFQALLDSTDVLRTVISYHSNGAPQQVVRAPFKFHLELVELCPEELSSWLGQRSRQRMTLGEGLFDSVLLKLDEQHYVWYFCQHHLIADAWSTGLIYKQMSELYQAAEHTNGKSCESVPFQEYLTLELLAKRKEESPQAEYWKHFQDIQSPSFYGRLRPLNSIKTTRNTLVLQPEMLQLVRMLADRPEVRMFSEDMSLFCVFSGLLFAFVNKVTGQKRLVMGAPSHNRSSRRLKDTIGPCLEVLPLSIEVVPQQSFLELLNAVREEYTNFLKYVGPGSSHFIGSQPFNFLLNYLNLEFGDFAGYPTEVDWVHSGHGDPGHLLRLQVHDFKGLGQTTLHFDLNDDVFLDQPGVIGQFHRLALGLLQDPGKPIGEVALADWQNGSIVMGEAQEAPDAQTVLDLLWKGGGNALSLGRQKCSYNQLYRRVERWASILRALEVGPGVTVGICLNRSFDLIVGVLSILRAGGAFVPIDIASPLERIEFILADSNCKFVIAERGLEIGHPNILRMASPPDISRPAPRASSSPQDLAYILYTSGSTGRPKGVRVGHEALLNYLTWARREYTKGEQLRFAFFTPLAFDLTLTSVFLPLISGGQLRIYPQESDQADLALLDLLEEDVCDVIKLTPSHLSLLEAETSSLGQIRRVIFGGEALRREQALRVATGREVYNEYGPTECTVGCIVHRFDPDNGEGLGVPIGRPIENVRAYVLDSFGNPVPRGVSGELYLGGKSLAQGYHQRDELDSRFFLPDPFLEGGRMYRTGDLARLREDGLLEYLGRTDRQVKVKGVRIELGEVEGALADHPGVKECVVVLKTRASQTHGFHCLSCGLASNYPGVTFDKDGVCNECRAFESYRERANEYFKTTDEFLALFEPRPSGRYDCLLLLSGGKDSCYVLYRLVRMGLRVLAFTLDNGYISDQAKGNIRRVVESLGVDHVFAVTEHMRAIFSDSLRRYCNVCQGCFKTIYTLAIKLALEKGIPYVVTGLSRGQLFETRLTRELFEDPNVTPQDIDATVLAARKAYHQVDDAANQLLNSGHLFDDQVFQKVQVVDFYRYCEVELSEVLLTLKERLPWLRPSDTGRSTNCRINDVGIYVHKAERGFHNYAQPYSWDVRLGHKNREEALVELNDDLDLRQVQNILKELSHPVPVGEDRLVGYYVGDSELVTSQLRDWMAARLPGYMIPSAFIELTELPLTTNGKVDHRRLSDSSESGVSGQCKVPPTTPAERVLAEVWAEVLGLPSVGIHDNFFDLGGDSISAIRIIGRANQSGLSLAHSQLFHHQTIAELARVASVSRPTEQGLVEGEVPLAPIQRWFFNKGLPNPERWCHVLTLSTPEGMKPKNLERALTQLVEHHDALRLSFRRNERGQYVQQHLPPFEMLLDHEYTYPNLDGPLIRAFLDEEHLQVILHHLVSDGLSWLVLVEDLEALFQGQELPAKTNSYKSWTEEIQNHKPIGTAYWRDLYEGWKPLPVDMPGPTPGYEASSRVLNVSLSSELSTNIEQTAAKLHCEVQDILLAALTDALKTWTGEHQFLIDLETPGRELPESGLDLSRTVGWFTAIVPVKLEPGTPTQVRAQLNSRPVKDQDYGVLRYAKGELLELGSEVLFSYFGRLGSTGGELFKPMAPPRLERDQDGLRSYLLEFYAMFEQDQLSFHLGYSCQRHRPDTIQRLADRISWVIKDLVSQKFPLAGLDSKGLTKVASLLNRKNRKVT